MYGIRTGYIELAAGIIGENGVGTGENRYDRWGDIIGAGSEAVGDGKVGDA